MTASQALVTVGRHRPCANHRCGEYPMELQSIGSEKYSTGLVRGGEFRDIKLHEDDIIIVTFCSAVHTHDIGMHI